MKNVHTFIFRLCSKSRASSKAICWQIHTKSPNKPAIERRKIRDQAKVRRYSLFTPHQKKKSFDMIKLIRRKEAKQKMENTRSTRNHKESVNMIHQTSLTPECAYWSEDTTNKHTNTQASKYTGLSLFSSAVCTFLDIIPASAVLLVSTRQTRLVPP